jgi:hypothetical protein
LQKAQRELEREKSKLEAQEKKTMADIKKNAKAGNMVSAGQVYPSLSDVTPHYLLFRAPPSNLPYLIHAVICSAAKADP